MTGWTSASDDRLLEAAANDVDAFTTLYRRYERPMLGFFLRRTGNAELAADLTAEVFAAVLVGSRRYRPGDAPARAWLFGIAQHKLISARRHGAVEDRARRRLGMAPIELDDDDLARIEREVGQAVELLDALPSDQRDAIKARVIDERSYEAIADELSCSPAVVRKRVSRGLVRLREQLREEGRA
jgi:RNA polymerase sigma-70 factor (ECF subfamily)